MDKKDATFELARLVAEFNAALDAAESFACAHNLSFRIDPCYGAGASFDGEEGEWYASSQSC